MVYNYCKSVYICKNIQFMTEQEKFKPGICPHCGWPYDGEMGGCEACQEKRKKIQEAIKKGYYNPYHDELIFDPDFQNSLSGLSEKELKELNQCLAEQESGPGAKAEDPRETKKEIEKTIKRLNKNLDISDEQEGLKQEKFKFK